MSAFWWLLTCLVFFGLGYYTGYRDKAEERAEDEAEADEFTGYCTDDEGYAP